MVLLNVHVRLAFGGPENEPSEPLNFQLVNDASNVLNVNGLLFHLIHQRGSLFVVFHVLPHLAIKLFRDLREHCFCHGQDLEAVFK